MWVDGGAQSDRDKTKWKNGTFCFACAALDQSRSTYKTSLQGHGRVFGGP